MKWIFSPQPPASGGSGAMATSNPAKLGGGRKRPGESAVAPDHPGYPAPGPAAIVNTFLDFLLERYAEGDFANTFTDGIIDNMFHAITAVSPKP